MPTENEIKYLLHNHPAVEAEIIQASKTYYDIDQGYLANGDGWNCRIRKMDEGKSSGPRYFYTYKNYANGRLIEIETEIDDRDYYDLFTSCKEVLQKRRFIIPFYGLTWEIDFYTDRTKNKEVYCILAEVELPEGTKLPHGIPTVIQKNLIQNNPVDPQVFGARKLADPKYASKQIERHL